MACTAAIHLRAVGQLRLLDIYVTKYPCSRPGGPENHAELSRLPTRFDEGRYMRYTHSLARCPTPSLSPVITPLDGHRVPSLRTHMLGCGALGTATCCAVC